MLLHLIGLFIINFFYIKIYRELSFLINRNIRYKIIFYAALLINNILLFLDLFL